jgi:hypothetical protein
VSPEDVGFASELLKAGLAPEAVQQKLIERGLSTDLAAKALEAVAEQDLLAESFSRLMEGQRPEAVKEFLVGRGMSPFVADEVLQEQVAQIQSMRPGPGPIRKVIGGLVVGLGVLLWLGNMTGVFPTFPFAGIIVIIIGFAIMGG